MTDTSARPAHVGRATVASLFLLGQFAFPAVAGADTSEEPPTLPQVHEFKGEQQPCGPEGTDTVDQLPWTHSSLGLDEAHRLSTGADVTVAVLAPELDATGPALADAVEQGETADCLGYGTFVAGIVGGRPFEGSGAVGVAPEATLRFVPTGSPDTGVATAGEIASGVVTAAESGASVILVATSAWSGSTELDQAVEAATEDGSLVVAPATVNTLRGPVPGHPAQHPSVLAVAGHTPEGPPSIESPLPLPDGTPSRVDLLAPGDRAVAPGVGGGHVTGSGAGVAAAFVAGTAALLTERFPDLGTEELRDRLLATAYPSPGGDDDPVHGSGRVDPVGALLSHPAEESVTVAGEVFVPDPSPQGTLEALPTSLVAGGFALLIVVCGLGAAVVRNGRARSWRPTAPGEPVPIGPPHDPLRD